MNKGIRLIAPVSLARPACSRNGGATEINSPAAPVLSLAAVGTKQLTFTWTGDTAVTHYKFYQDPDGVSGYTQLGADIAAGTTSTTVDIAVHRHNWANARYLVEACDADGCSASEGVTTASAMLEAIGYVKASNTEAVDLFGWSLALSGDGTTLAVGAYHEDSAATGIDGDQADNAASYAGAVYVFSRNAGGAWHQQAYVKASNTQVADYFGHALALSADGNTLAVGAHREDSAATGINGNPTDNTASDAGAVYVFARDVDGNWGQTAYVKASNTRCGDHFGYALALSVDGNTLAVGATRESSAATGIDGEQTNGFLTYTAGAVYVFTRDTDGAWSQQAYVKASNTEGFDRFGHAVALSADGNTLAVGSRDEGSAATGIDGDQTDNTASDAGAVYVFTRRSGAWSQQAYVKASNTQANNYFGGSLVLSADGNTLAVGAGSEDSAATGIDGDQTDNSAHTAGAVYVFTRRSGAWSQQAYVKASNTQANDRFGSSLTMSADGNTLAVGASNEDSAATGIDGDQTDNNAIIAGAVYVFTRNGAAWHQQAYVKASNTRAGDYFGLAVAMSADGNTLAVGASNEDSAATGIDGDQTDNSAISAGAVYLY